MTAYIVKRLLLMLPTGVGIIAVFFFISELVPGGPLDQVEVMIRDQASREGEGAGLGAEGAGGSMEIDPEIRMRIKRQLGLNHNQGERFMRMLLWFAQDSLISSVEVPEGESRRITFRGEEYVVFREGNQYHLYLNRIDLPGGGTAHLSFDRESRLYSSSADPGVRFDPITGNRIGGGKALTPIPVRVETHRFQETSYDLSGERVPVMEERQEVYLDIPLRSALTTWDNWHGYFLLKFPNSISKNKPAYDLIIERLPVSVRLGVISFFLTYSLCLILGIAKAVRNGTRFDAITSILILVGYGIPGFVLAVFLLTMFGPGGDAILNLFPLGGLHSPPEIYNQMGLWEKFWDNVHHLLAPILCLTLGSFAGLTLLTKNSVLEEFDQLYATAARARGLSGRKVLLKHILRNSLIPLITGFPARFVMMFFAGSVLIEKIFSLDGLGLLSYTALVERDYPLIISSMFVFTYLGLLCRLLSDIGYVIADPRISFEENQS